jgi:hypothetical protein
MRTVTGGHSSTSAVRLHLYGDLMMNALNNLQWNVLVDDLVLSLDARPLVLLAVLGALALAVALRTSRGTGAVGLAVALAGSGVGLLFSLSNTLRELTSSKVTSVARAFSGAVALDAVFVTVAAGAGALAIASAALAFTQDRWVAAAGACIAVFLAAVTAFGAVAHLRALQRIGAIPRVEARGCERIHAGLTCTPDLELFAHGRVRSVRKWIFFPTGRTAPAHLLSDPTPRRAYADARGWTIPSVGFHAEQAGRGLTFAVAERPMLKVTRPLRFEVAEERMDPRFAPEVGDAWRFTRAQRRSTTVLFFLRSSHNHKVDAELRATGRVVVDGKRAVVVERTGFGHPALYYVAGVDGETLFRARDAGPSAWRPAITRRDITEPLPDDFLERDMKRHLDEDVALDGPDVDVFRCDFGLLPASGCDCSERAMGGPRKKAGPVLCHLPRNGAADVVNALVTVFTLGLVIPDEGAPVYALMSSGPQEAR